ncbi:MAG: hypothetical protein O7E57_00595 [Gammaproteobacteria bacterium]|nr:hypothetical protein [Gammaproteobacteria bacterium]
MASTKVLCFTLVASFVVHLIVLNNFEPLDQPELPEIASFEITLVVPPLRPVPDVAEALPLPVEPVVAVEEPDPDFVPEVAAAIPVPLPAREPAESAALNLNRPDSWATATPRGRGIGVFDESLGENIARSREDRQRREALEIRVTERDGVSDDEYIRRDQFGAVVKTDSRCFSLRHERGSSGFAQRWWRTSCNEELVSPWEQAPLALDATGRLLMD